ncbi:MAG TPA: hypothetical protein VMH04_05615 [Candidatus Solibacter sp.]|nr:hypothetical protein [Candidatus Solibacter sp.]
MDKILFRIVLLCAMAIPFLAQAQKSETKPTADLPAGAMQAKATTSCLECHEARIILQQRLSKAAWTKEVDKMIKWGAVVDANDHDALIDYLSTNFNPDQAPYEPPRTAAEKESAHPAAKKSK